MTIPSVGRPANAAQTVAAESARHAGAVIAVRAAIACGDPAAAPGERAEHGDVDLLVLGNDGMTGPSCFLLGSVPDKVSHHASVAVLTVRTV